ncbi:efflux RND transporter permease subunit [Shigella flexneri]
MGHIGWHWSGIAMVFRRDSGTMAFFGGTTVPSIASSLLPLLAVMALSATGSECTSLRLCAPHDSSHSKKVSIMGKGFFALFNQTLHRNAERYEKGVAKILHRSLRWIAIYVLLLAMVFRLPAFADVVLPLEDRGRFIYLGTVAQRFNDNRP